VVPSVVMVVVLEVKHVSSTGCIRGCTRGTIIRRGWCACDSQETGTVGETDAQGRLAVGTADASLTVVAGALAGGGTRVESQNGWDQREDES
jgi:hypothetical protein